MTTEALRSISSKTANILILAESPTSCDTLTVALRSCGFVNMTFSNSIDDVRQKIHEKTTPMDWLIALTPTSTTHVENIASAVNSTDHGHKPFVSVFIYNSLKLEQSLYKYFGFSSLHIFPGNPSNIEQEIAALLQVLKIWDHNPAKITASYERRRILAANHFDKLLSFDHELIDRFPNEPRLLMNLAESNFLCGNSDAAITLLVQAKNMDSRLSSEIASLYSRIKEKLTISSPESAGADKTTCVVIESDPSVLNQILKTIETLGIKNPKVFDNGKTAWEWLANNPEPELLVTEWKLPGLTGSPLIQRLRNLGRNKVPIMVCSSRVTPEEMPLFKEFSISHLIKKPTTQRELSMALNWVLQQHKHPTNQTSLEKELALAIKRKDWVKAKNLKAAYMANNKVLDSRKKLIEAEFLYQERKYTDAIEVAKTAAKMAEVDSLDFVDLMARCHLGLGYDTSAAKLMTAASQISPQNVSRLCELANLNNHLGAPQNSEKILQAALHIDRSRPDVVESVSKWSLVIDNDDKVEKIMEHVQDKLKIIAHFNNRAVQLTQEHQNTQALKIYRLILKVVPQDQPELRARIEYNLALGLVKVGKFAQALQIISASNCKKFSTIHQKMESLKSRTEDALKEIQNMTITNQSSDATNGTSSANASTATLSIINELQILEALLQAEEDQALEPESTPEKKGAA